MNKYRYCPDEYFKSIYGVYKSPFENVSDEAGCKEKCADVRQKVKSLLATDNIPLRTDELSPEILKTEKRKNYTVKTLSVEICKNLNMLCYVLIPDTRNGRGVVAVCGHGYGCRQIIRQSKSGKYRKINFFDNYQKNFAEALAENGNTVIVPEPVGFGEAKLKKDFFKPFYSSSCDTVSHHSLIYGFSTASLRVYQTMRCIDLLTGTFGCDGVGCMGISGGGLVALYSACVDDRISKVCVCGYINTFRSSVLNMWHCPDNYIPGILREGEMYDFAAALAPRKLMMEYGTRDKLFPIEASRKAKDEIQRIYELAGEKENFYPVEFEGKHEVYLPAALEFFGD